MPKKSAQKKVFYKKSSYQTKLALVVLGLIILILIIGKAINVLTSFGQPISGDGVYRQGVWDGESNINLVIQTNTVSVLSYSPKNKTIFLLSFPDSLLVNVPSGFGSWQISSVYELGQAENSMGAKLLKFSVSNLLGVPIDGYLKFEGDYQNKTPEEVLTELRDGVFTSFKMLGSVKTDLSMQELFSLTTGISNVRFDKIEDYSLSKLNLVSPYQLPDGSPVFVTDPVKTDSLSSNFLEVPMVEEKSSVAVFNGTDTPGLALKASRMISNIGGNVIISTNTASNPKRSVVVVGDTSLIQSFTAKKLAQIFTSACSDSLKCDIMVCDASDRSSQSGCSSLDSQVLSSRAQISIVLGEDFAGRF